MLVTVLVQVNQKGSGTRDAESVCSPSPYQPSGTLRRKLFSDEQPPRGTRRRNSLFVTGPAGLEHQGWRDGNACTTSELRGFLRGAYTGGESPLLARIGRIGVFCEPTGREQAGQAPQPGEKGRAVRIKRTGYNQTWKKYS